MCSVCFHATLLAALLLVQPAVALAHSKAGVPASTESRQGTAPARISLNAQAVELALADAIYLGLRDNRTIRSAYLDRIAQKFDLRVAEARFTPRLLLSASYLSARNQSDHYRQGSLTPTATLLTPYGTRVSLGWTYRHAQAELAGASRNDGANFSLIQPLLRGAGKDVAMAPVRVARLAEQARRLQLKSTVSRTITQLIASYRALLQAQEQLKIAQESLERAHQLVEVNRAMIDAGRMAEFEIVQTQAEVASQELFHEDARNQLETARLALLQFLALDLNTQIVASEAPRARHVQVDGSQALAHALASQPGYLSQLIAAEQAAIQLKLAQNERLWDVSLVGGAAQVRDRAALNGATRVWDNYVGIQVAIPLGDLSLRQAEVQAQVQVASQQLLLDEARQQLEREVVNAVRGVDTRWRQYEIAQRARDLSRRKLEIEREKLTAGRSSNFQVLSFENDLRNAESALLNTLINYLNTQAQLDEALGTTLQSWDIALHD